MLSEGDLERFIEQGFVRIDGAFSHITAEQERAILWRHTGCDPADPTTWMQPVIRLGLYADTPFVEAANTNALHEAFDQLVGRGRWLRRVNLGTFPSVSLTDRPGRRRMARRCELRRGGSGFPFVASERDLKGSSAPDVVSLFRRRPRRCTDAHSGRITSRDRQNACSGWRGGPLPARAGRVRVMDTAGSRQVLATGDAGTVYLCHPFLVHAAQSHRGARPRFMAQPPLLPAEPVALLRADGGTSPVEQAIRRGVGK